MYLLQELLRFRILPIPVTIRKFYRSFNFQIPRCILSKTVVEPLTNLQIVRYRRSKHWVPKWKQLRKEKVIKVDLPNFNEKVSEMSPNKIRQRMKEMGVLPPRPWMERPFHVSSTGTLIDPYVPPEGDGKMSMVTTAGAKQKVEFIEKKSKSMMAVRKIRSFDEDFKTKEFAQQAQDIYIKAHTYVALLDRRKVREYVTEKCYPEINHNTLFKTIHWKFLKSLEPPRVVYARCAEVFSKDNIFGQVTVRFHTQQLLAIYDRFGRLMHGSEIIAKDVLEYVVFEKHLSNVYGTWRMHDKIIPDWMPPKEPSARTFVAEEAEETGEETEANTDLVKLNKLRRPLQPDETPPPASN